MKTIGKTIYSLVFIFIVGISFSGCYTQFALDRYHPSYRDRQNREEPQEQQQDYATDQQENDSSLVDSSIAYNTNDYQYDNDEQNPDYGTGNTINNYYGGTDEWWPHHHFGYSYYWPSSSFWVSYNDPWLYSSSYYYPNYYSNYGWGSGWCGTHYVGYWGYNPYSYGYNPYWGWGYGYYGGSGYGYTPHQDVKHPRNFGRTRDGSTVDGSTRINSRENSNIGVSGIQTQGGTISVSGNSRVNTSGSVVRTNNNNTRRNNTRIRSNGGGRLGYNNTRNSGTRIIKELNHNTIDPPARIDVEKQQPQKRTNTRDGRRENNTPRNNTPRTITPRNDDVQRNDTPRNNDVQRNDTPRQIEQSVSRPQPNFQQPPPVQQNRGNDNGNRPRPNERNR